MNITVALKRGSGGYQAALAKQPVRRAARDLGQITRAQVGCVTLIVQPTIIDEPGPQPIQPSLAA